MSGPIGWYIPLKECIVCVALYMHILLLGLIATEVVLSICGGALYSDTAN